jgi:hypothetical protein
MVPKPLQQWLASSIPIVGQADPNSLVEEIPRTTSKASGSQPQTLNVNIQDLPGVLNHIKGQSGKPKRRG